jgi:non-ribosomal peptide synthetase component F
LEISPPEWIDNRTSKFDLSLELVATAGAAGFFEYSTELFKDETIAQMATDYQALLGSLVQRPDLPLLQLEPVREIRSRIQQRCSG